MTKRVPRMESEGSNKAVPKTAQTGALPVTWPGMSDALGFAKSVDEGRPMTFYRNTEFFFEGVRFNPGTYELRKVPCASPKASLPQPSNG